MRGLVLCDPALLMPPPPDEDGAARFWARLIEWSADHRVRLGPASHAVVVAMLGQFGYPKRDGSQYPPGLAQLAHRTLAIMLGQALPGSISDSPPSLTPRYIANCEGEAAIGSDIVALQQRLLLGLATAQEHWESCSDRVVLDPPSPDSLPLLIEPKAPLKAESDQAVRIFFKKRRLTIVGGVPNDALIGELEQRFEPKEIRWLRAEPGSNLNLDSLSGIQARIDVVYCITGHIGHDGSIKAKQCCRKRGIELRKVSRANEIAEDLCRRHGDS